MGKTKASRLNFTKRAIESLAAPEKNARALHYDSQVRGLGVMIQPPTLKSPLGHRAFFWYRKIRGRPTWKTIGEFPALSVEEARARAAELNATAAQWKAHDYEGPDPINRRRGLTLSALFEDYRERRLKSHAKDPDRAIAYAGYEFKHLAAWSNRNLGTISRADVRALHEELGKPKGKVKARKVTANRTIQLLRTLFNWALKTEMWSGQNPAHGIVPFPESSRTRFLQPNEAPKLFKALSEETNLDLRDFVLLALFTGARRSNTLAMRWEQLDLKRGLWSIPDQKSRVPYIVPLTDEAIEILKQRSRAAKEKARGTSENITDPWVFPSRGRTGHVTDLKRSWGQFLKRAEIDGLHIHDLRRTLGSWQAGAGVSLPVIGKTLGHQSSDATEVYARLHLDPVRKAINAATGAMMIAGKVPRGKLLKAANRD